MRITLDGKPHRKVRRFKAGLQFWWVYPESGGRVPHVHLLPVTLMRSVSSPDQSSGPVPGETCVAQVKDLPTLTAFCALALAWHLTPHCG